MNVEDRLKGHNDSIQSVIAQRDILAKMVSIVCQRFQNDGKLYIMGNGGSAADAQHIAAELIGRFKQKSRAALPAIALTTDTSLLTSVGNDFSFDQIFVRQIDGLVAKRDVLWALSTSGQSPNIIKGITAARSIGCDILGFTSTYGVETMRDFCNFLLVVEGSKSDRIQEAHQFAYHLICDEIDRYFSI
jgi:D-sedoheptulose 7-phosphate isomerase